MNRNPMVLIIVLALVVAGGWYLLSKSPAKEAGPEGGATSQTPAGDSTTPEATTETATDVIVTYTDEGFSPANVTISPGMYVVFVNQSSKNMWVASAKHPDHTVYSGTTLAQHCPDTSGTAFDQCMGSAPGSSYSFKFNKAGEWKYHDHIDATKFGSVVVTP